MKKKKEKSRRTANNPKYLSKYWSFNPFLKTDIGDDNFTLSSMVFQTWTLKMDIKFAIISSSMRKVVGVLRECSVPWPQ